MTLFKKFAKYGSTVVASLAVAVALLMTGSQRVAHATVTLPLGTAPVMATGLTETWTVTFTESATVGITTASVTFPAGFTVPQGTITGATATGGAACTGVAATGASQIVSFTMTSCATAIAATNNFTIPGVTNPTTAGATALGFTVKTSVDATGATGAAPVIWNTTAAKSPTTNVQADGSSTVAVTFTVSGTSTNTGTGTTLVVSATTDVGTFSTTPTAANTGFANIVAVTTPVTTVSASIAATVGSTGTFVTTVKAPSTAGASTVILRVTPVGGGQSVIIGSSQITWIAASTQGAVATGSVTPAAPVIIAAASGTQILTFTFLDASGNAPIPGATLTCTSSLGTLTAPTNGTGTGTQQVVGTVPVGGIFLVTINGSGLGGTSTVSCVAGTVTVTKSVSVTGLAATIDLKTCRANTTSCTAKNSLRNTDVATGNDQDELLAVAIVKDAQGNNLASGSVVFTLTTPAGSTLTFQNMAAQTASSTTVESTTVGNLTIATAATCAAAGLTCTDSIEVGGGGTNIPAAIAYVDSDSVTGEPVGTYTIRAIMTNSDGTRADSSVTFTVVKAPATLTIPAAVSVPVGASQAVNIECKDADRNACPSGTLITVNVSSLNLIAQNAATGTTGASVADFRTNDAGTASVTLLGVSAGVGQLVVNTSTVTALSNITVGLTGSGGTTAPPAGTVGTFSGGTISATGVSIVSFTGTTAQLATAGAASKIVSVSATVGGKLITNVVGAPDFVNAEFNTAFSSGLTATLVIVKTGA